MKTLIVDGQIWQTNALYRGMGGYAYSVIAHVAAQQPDLRLIVLLNTAMPHDPERVRLIQTKLPTAELHYLDLPFQPAPAAGEEARAVVALDAFVAEHVRTPKEETYYFIPALFLFDYCAVFPMNTRKLLLFHDLTPLIFREDMTKYFPGHLYFPRFATIFEADIVFTNSQTTGNDLERYLGISQDRLANLDGSLKAEAAGAERDDSVLRRLGLQHKTYILMPTGGTEFKNNLRAAQAFTNLRQELSIDIQLVVTSFFRDIEKAELQLAAPDGLTFTNNVNDAELVSLYAHCQAVLLPSLYEGLGLPVLEGVDHDKPVACSDIPVFREIPHFNEALYVFDPYSVPAIQQALLQALAGADFAQKRAFYPAILDKYNWPRSATLFLAALGEAARFTPPAAAVKRVAVVIPDPRKNNDVAVFAQRMHGYGQQQGIEFVYFIDSGGDDDIAAPVLADYVRQLALCYDIAVLYDKLATEHFDAVLHFPSNDPRFTQLLRAALSVPGYVYISQQGYHDVVALLAEKGMISASQASVEGQAYALAQEAKAFETPTLLTAATGIIVEKPVRGVLDKAVHAFGITAPVVDVPASAQVNHGPRALERQRHVYQQIFAFMEGK